MVEIIYKRKAIGYYIDKDRNIISPKGNIMKLTPRRDKNSVTLYIEKGKGRRKQTTLLVERINLETGVYKKAIDKYFTDEDFDFSIPHKEYLGKYFITEDGRIWSKYLHRWIIQQKQTCGYMSCVLAGKQWYVHRLMWHVWRSPMETGSIHDNGNKPEINHIDLDKCNNHIDNLELCADRAANHQHTISVRGRLQVKEKWNSNNFGPHSVRYSVLKIDKMTGETIKIYNNIDEACREEGMLKQNMWGRLSGNVSAKKEKYLWKYGEKIKQS